MGNFSKYYLQKNRRKATGFRHGEYVKEILAAS